MSKSTRTALVLGATGGIGGETAHAKIRALSRNGKSAGTPTSWEWVKGDSLNQTSITAAADGADAIVHAVNPPGYKNWATLVLPMLENTISAARVSGARILLPGTIYNSSTHKGKIRITLEEKLGPLLERASAL